METLISSLIVAALTGLAFLAYKHPDAFKPIYGLLNGLGAAVIVGLTIWNTALSQGFTKIIPYLMKDEGAWESAHAAVNSLEVPFGITILVYISVAVFLGFLSILPKLLEKETKKTDDEKENET